MQNSLRSDKLTLGCQLPLGCQPPISKPWLQATATKTYRFGLASRAEQHEWLEALQDAIAVANNLELSLTIQRRNLTIFNER
jgi:hypothetical protein